MKISCIHCSYEFTISADQLGGRGNCPRCHGEIELPNLSDQPEQDYEARPFAWIENSVSALGSLVFHMALFLILALIVQQNTGGGMIGEGEMVSIGELPAESLSKTADEQLSADEVNTTQDSSLEQLEVTTPDATADSVLVDVVTPSSLGGSSGFENALNVTIAGSGGGGDGFDQMVNRLRRNGLDIVIVFDSTGSMGGEINQVKSQIRRIGGALTSLIPKTRIGVCTYRDLTDAYIVKGHPLSGEIQTVATYLSDIGASGGGDMPEAVQEGLKWTIENNDFKNNARKVILLFGDAPPHAEHMKQCLELAADFNSQQGGVVSTVTCLRGRNAGAPLPEFVEIAQAGGGEAFLTSDERQIMTQLVVLVFGSRHRSKVLEAFKLLER